MVVAILVAGILYESFLYQWDSRAPGEHCTRADWPLRNESKIGLHNAVIRRRLVAKENNFSSISYKIGLNETICESFETR